MKTVLRTVFSALLLTAYLFVTNLVVVEQQVQTAEQASFQALHYSFSTAQDVPSFGNFNSVQPFALAKISLGYFFIVDFTNGLLLSRVQQYEKIFLKFLVKIQKSDLIFPFHYFL